LELLGTELGMFRNDGPPKPITLEDLSTEDLNRLLAEPTADEEIRRPSPSRKVSQNSGKTLFTFERHFLIQLTPIDGATLASTAASRTEGTDRGNHPQANAY
jgi:hypothetical protein